MDFAGGAGDGFRRVNAISALNMKYLYGPVPSHTSPARRGGVLSLRGYGEGANLRVAAGDSLYWST